MTLDKERLMSLLIKASRTFALNIPLLPAPLMDAMTVGYLLMRNADTIEDAYRWSRERRVRELENLIEVVTHPEDRGLAEAFAARFSPQEEVEDAAHLEVLRETPYVMDTLNSLPPTYAPIVVEHAARVARRMIAWVESHDEANHLSLQRLQELDEYCYSVAGIVGEMITSLIAVYSPGISRPRLLYLRTLETAFGAGLQLTNIIKDVFRDHGEGRHYIPQEFLPLGPEDGMERISPMFTYAYRRLSQGIDYVLALPVGETGIRKFCLVPLLLAAATLVRLQEHTDELFSGADVKISREMVVELLAAAERVVSDNLQVRRLWEQVTGPLVALKDVYTAPELQRV
ncbi:MAG: squalene/phytoene synthase family protein [Chloroflexi bacterium]|nr:squalene/phytoene synthase family protein [Chloroflexota bacterium]